MVVQRYTICGHAQAHAEDEFGKFVYYSDYQKLEQKLLIAELENSTLAANALQKIRQLQDEIAEILASLVEEDSTDQLNSSEQ